jgi:hypothetical protein
MKTPWRLLLASAAILLGFLSGPCFAQSDSVSILLTGTIANGKSLTVTSGTDTIVPAELYYYSISGSCHATGQLADIISGEVDLSTALDLADPGLVPYLNGVVLDPSAKLPFVCVNKLAKGKFTFGTPPFAVTVAGSVRTKAGILKKGECYGEFTNISFTVDGVPNSSTIVIDGGQCLVQTNPISGPASPNLSFIDSIGHLDGIGITGSDAVGHSEEVSLKKGKSASFTFALVNSGTGASTFSVTSPAPGSGFTDKFIYKSKNETVEVSGAGLTVPSKGTLGGGDAATLTWELTNKDASAGTVVSPVLTAIPGLSGTGEDQLVITGTAAD